MRGSYRVVGLIGGGSQVLENAPKAEVVTGTQGNNALLVANAVAPASVVDPSR